MSLFILQSLFLFLMIQLSDQQTYTCNQNASCGCSQKLPVLSRIVGGEAAPTGAWNWAVSISIAGNSLCGGSILSSSWIITAAHCLEGYSASQVRIYAGSNARYAGTQIRTANQLILHSGYVASTFENDIALIYLSDSLNMSDPNISTICLPSVSAAVLAAGEWPPVNTLLVVVGWGRLSTDGILPSSLQQVTVPVVDYRSPSCSPLISNWRVQFCAGIPGSGKDACQGDSGGPIMMFNSNRQWILVGVTSTGAECASDQYSGVYTRVAAFNDWIATNTNGTLSTTIVSTTSTTTGSTVPTTRVTEMTVSSTIKPIISRSTSISTSALLLPLISCLLWLL